MTADPTHEASPPAQPPRRNRLLRFFAHPKVNIMIGGAVIVCSVAEIIDELVGSDLKAAHGMVILGAAHALRALGELGEGTHKLIQKAEHVL